MATTKEQTIITAEELKTFIIAVSLNRMYDNPIKWFYFNIKDEQSVLMNISSRDNVEDSIVSVHFDSTDSINELCAWLNINILNPLKYQNYLQKPMASNKGKL
jgi:hypothetical protein